MDEFDFTDGLKIVLVAIFMLGSVQLHALIDESSQHVEDRGQRAASADWPVSAAIHPAMTVRVGLLEMAASVMRSSQVSTSWSWPL